MCLATKKYRLSLKKCGNSVAKQASRELLKENELNKPLNSLTAINV